MRLPPVPLLLAVLCVQTVARPVRAQVPSNAEVLGRLGAACVADVTVPDAFYLAVPPSSPYLRSALNTAFGTSGRRVLADSAAARLSVAVEQAGIAYTHAGRGRLRRTASLRLRMQVVDMDRTVRHDHACGRTATDVVATRQRSALEDAAWPETRGSGPPPSRLRRTLEVGLVAGVVVTSTLLLFSLRSR